ncbi:MAG: flagellar biosynthetic protein FliQ [Phycisphaerales bacterium]|nr:flagellar biosynthetic protein FliQ [Phycisphaerales bacterium]MCI0631622.1 flagellar biosynthetic protein FliQ [Phycisphaerales bacterium]MCI0674306.1 flagellar biosynthetic protein FliQ [Phycisphaerales bacterium]
MQLDAVELVRVALMEALIVLLPILGAGLVVGFIVSVLQAMTQIQEQMLSFVPKAAAMILAVIVLSGWLTMRLCEFASAMFSGI